MKYLFIILTSFILITPVYAAREVPGSVPVVKPLQPPSAFAHPNFSSNIQSSGSSQNGSSVQPPSGQNSGQTVGAEPGSAQLPLSSSSLPQSGGHGVFWWVAAFLALAVLGWVWFKQRNNPQ